MPSVYENILNQLNKLDRLSRQRQILYQEGPLSGLVSCCYVLGVDSLTGDLYYKNEDGNWEIAATGGGGVFDSTVDFSVNTNPNTAGTTFSPDTPNDTTVIYVSTIDGSQWTSDGLTYTLYIAPYWAKNGNSGTNITTNFIGTTDFVGLAFRVNNLKSGIISTNGSTSFGYKSLLLNTAVSNTAFGWQTLSNVVSGTNNTGFGYRVLELTTGPANTGFGSLVLMTNSTGVNNTGIGRESLMLNTIGRENTGVGYASLRSMIDGQRNTSVGYNSMLSSTTGDDNTAIGSGALSGTTGSKNIGIGLQAGYNNTTGSNQIFINSIARANYVADQTESPIYIQQNATVVLQLLRLNGLTGLNVTPISTLDNSGSFGAAITTLSTDTTLDATHYTVLVDATAGNVTITLPAAASSTRRIYNIKKIDATVNTVIIDGNASETIDGALTQVISTQWSNLQIHCNGTSWFIL